MTREERSLVCSRLADSLHLLLQETERLNESQWGFKPSGSAWSAGQCVEHITEVESELNDRMQAILAEGFSDPKMCSEAEGKERLLLRAVPNRTRHAQAPKQPDNSPAFYLPAVGLDAFKQIRARTVQFAQTTDAELEKYVYPHFVFGQLNFYQWLLLLSLHCERHTAQILEIKANPEFPKS